MVRVLTRRGIVLVEKRLVPCVITALEHLQPGRELTAGRRIGQAHLAEGVHHKGRQQDNEHSAAARKDQAHTPLLMVAIISDAYVQPAVARAITRFMGYR